VAAAWVADTPSWAAQRLDPSLEGKAVVVVDARRAVGANTQARATGVRLGDALDRVRGLCPEAVLVPASSSTVEAAWDGALSSLSGLTPWLESVRPGLAYLAGVTALEAESLANELGVRVGLSRSRGTALLAALSAVENRARGVGDESGFLESVPTYLLRGAGVPEDVIEKLKLFGWRTLGDVRCRVSKAQLEAQFGVHAGRVWALAHGLDTVPIPVFTPPPEITVSDEFELPALEPHQFQPALERCVQRAVAALGERLAGNITVRLRSQLGLSQSRRILKDFSRDPRTILLVSQQALEDALPGLELLSLSVILSDLHRLVPYQDSLFDALERADVREAIGRVHLRFPEKIGRFEVHRPHATLPERRYRFVPLTGLEPKRPAPKRSRTRQDAALRGSR
jgi:nucleotidyltransferase/DNA polymerase involved in DNA repair